MATFHAVASSSRRIHVQIAKELASKILTGELKEGEKLPSELELCEQFGISRTALRESTKLLSAKGLIESKPKVGTNIMPRQSWHFLDPQFLDWVKDTNNVQRFLTQFLGLRKAIEPEACAMAAKNASIEHRKALSVSFQNMTHAAENHDYTSWTLNDHEFHKTIFLATANPFYIPFSNILDAIFKTFIDEAAVGGRFCLEEHQDIYEAIMAGDAPLARSASQLLLNDHNQRLSSLDVA
ncbi:GntR family transcriptional regulator [Vibrio sp. 10N.286.49.C2]|uniref:FadR/GntR family transcriptional regulator n=1 Tax=unclassified Vibrio TaxID=2614977 RepID=UPI000C815BC9|nr:MULTISPECIES: FadR/GntR family transcriptional regulator [unclassified Vibrio]PMH36754.1 GntR family transcriptional regulator [Vibrio sp. 10N.286.49.C2]PMH54742.1 GntR family transcriptional regulator [Vibrio sp. 10N.286.49.B1]PMH79399.1 GntR family transcriptional regulator [Vibrio sp. 10N.286.48.B7]